METAGTKLQRARQLRHLSIEDVSRATKIRPHQLAELEADDYSNFANLAYAKSFLIAYGKYLRVDVHPYMEAFTDANTFGLDDYQYLSDQPLGVYRVTRRATRHTRRLRRRRVMLGVTAAGLVAIGLFCRLFYISYERLGDLDKIAARREARENPAPDPVAAAAVTSDEAVQPGSVELPALTPPVLVAEQTPGPTVPLPGDGSAVRELLIAQPVPKPSAYDDGAAASGRRPAAAAVAIHAEEPPQPQQVVNNGPNLPVN